MLKKTVIKISVIIALFSTFAMATVSSTMPPARYSCNGTLTEFDFSYSIGETTDIVVTLRNTTTGAETDLTNGVDYTVSATNNEYASGGTVTTAETYSSSYTIVIDRATPNTQETHFIEGGVFPAITTEAELDKIVRQIQDQQRTVGLCFKIPKTDSSSIETELDSSIDRANRIFGFDANGNPELYIDGENIDANLVITAWAETLLDDSNIADARSTLGISTFGSTLIDDANATAARATLGITESSGSGIGVNVLDYGAVGDGVTDDTEAIQKAIFAVSPITTAYNVQTLANYTPGDAFDSNNVYRGGGVVYFPRGVYKTTDTIFINTNVRLVGEGHQGIFSTTDDDSFKLTDPRGSTIYFAPAVTTNKVAIAATSFVKSTGQRYDITDFYVDRTSNNSRTYNAGIEGLTVWCKENTLQGIRLQSAVTCDIENVSVWGKPKAAMVITDSVTNSLHNVNLKSIEQGLVLNNVSVLAVSGSSYIRPIWPAEWTGTPPYIHSVDDYNSLSTGVYMNRANQVTMTCTTLERWERGFFVKNSGVLLLQPYFENISDIIFGCWATSLNIIEPFFGSEDANAFYCEYASPYEVSNETRQIHLSGDYLGNRYNQFMLLDGPDGGTTYGYGNELGGFVVEKLKSEVLTENDEDDYEWITFKNNAESVNAKSEIIDKIKYDIATAPANVVALWVFDKTRSNVITDYSGNSRNMITSDDISTLFPKFSGLAPLIDFDADQTSRAHTADHADFSFGNGSADSAFSIVALVRFDDDDGKPFLAKKDSTTGDVQREWFFGVDDDANLYFELRDESPVEDGVVRLRSDANMLPDNGEIHCYTATYDGTGGNNAYTGMTIYRDGVAIAQTGSENGSYDAMNDMDAFVGTYNTLSSGSVYNSHHGYILVAVFDEELSATNVARMSALLRGYAGVDF